MRVVVVGTGVAGLGAAIALGPRGHQVTLLDRDTTEPPDSIGAIFDGWQRPGVPHFRNPHAFVSLGRKILSERIPAAFSALMAAGALDVQISERIPGGAPETADREIALLGCRRPIIEWALRRAAYAQPGVRVFLGARVEELVGRGSPPRITGVRTQNGEVVDADLVVDASGRSTRLGTWLGALGGQRPREESEACGVVYYSRYFRYRGDVRLSTRISPLGPRGDLGYMGFATFPGDNDTWAMTFNAPAWRPEFHALRDEETHFAAARSIPALSEAIAPENSDPITEVLPMGGLRNVSRELMVDDAPVALGVVAIGDALAHTNPAYAWGLSLGLEQAFGLAALVDEWGADVDALVRAFDRTYGEHARACYRVSRDTDLARVRVWRGEAKTPTTPDGPELALFLVSVCFVAALTDRDLFRAAFRRAQLLDPLDKLPGDRDLLERAAAIFAERIQTNGPPRLGPTNDEMLALLRERVSA